MHTKIDRTLISLVVGAALLLFVGSHFTAGDLPGASGESDGTPAAFVNASTADFPNDASAGPAVFFHEANGVIRAGTDGVLNLDSTEGKPFRLTGKVWLNGPSPTVRYPGDMPDGFSLWVRAVNGTHRYELNTRRLRVKRRLNHGLLETDIVPIANLKDPWLGEWISFSVEATEDHIVFKLGDQSGEIRGPLNMDGANKIALAGGSQVRDLRLELTGSGQIKRVKIQ